MLILEKIQLQRNIQSTALNTNLEAANEIARQIRLRDLGWSYSN